MSEQVLGIPWDVDTEGLGEYMSKFGDLEDCIVMKHDLTCPVKTYCSFWTLEDDVMHTTFQKRDKGQTWSSPIVGQGQLDPYTTDLEQKRLMLQRFQEEAYVQQLESSRMKLTQLEQELQQARRRAELMKKSNGQFFLEEKLLKWFAELLLAVEYPHSNFVLHRAEIWVSPLKPWTLCDLIIGEETTSVEGP